MTATAWLIGPLASTAWVGAAQKQARNHKRIYDMYNLDQHPTPGTDLFRAYMLEKMNHIVSSPALFTSPLAPVVTAVLCRQLHSGSTSRPSHPCSVPSALKSVTHLLHMQPQSQPTPGKRLSNPLQMKGGATPMHVCSLVHVAV